MQTKRTTAGDRTLNVQTAIEYSIGAIALALLIAGALLSGHSGAPAFETSAITVSAGDSLWSLAKEHPIPGLDTAQTVEAIAALNDVAGSTIEAGATLLVPSAGSEADSAGVLAMGASRAN